MAKTVTLKQARPGRSSVHVDDYAFPLGEPVRDVPDAIIARLKQIPGVDVHVTASSRTTDHDSSQED